MSFFQRVFLSFLITAFGQPAWMPGLGVLAAAFGFALFWRAMLAFSSKPRERFWLSVIWFSCVQGVQLSWMTTMDYMGPLILLLYLGLILGMGLQFGVLSFFFQRGAIYWHRALAIAGCWTIFEWLRLFVLCGFTWNPLGLALADSPYSLQFASLWGIFGLSFWVILVNLAALNAMIEKSLKKIALWAAVAFFPYLFGVAHQAWAESHILFSGNLRVALVQTALFPEQRDLFPDAINAYIPPLLQWERILQTLDSQKKVDLVILPEAALPLGAHKASYDFTSVRKYFDPHTLPPLKDPYALFQEGSWKVSNAFLLQALANQLDAHVIIGLDDVDFSGKYNAAFHFYPQNLPYERYEKQILLPIAEYIPLSAWRSWSRFIAKQFGIFDSFDHGSESKIFQAQFPIGISICYEETFSHFMRKLRVKGAKLFVNLTNDAWFPHSKLPQQHFDHGRVRAAENGVAILRACNTGITGGIDCFGKPLIQLPPSEEKASALYFSLPIHSYSTLYTFWGDGAILAISAIALASYFPLQARRKSCPK